VACLGEDAQLKALFWPHKDSRHSHLEFSICGFAINGESVWLDPCRDNLQLNCDPENNLIIAQWSINHIAMSGCKVTKTCSAFNTYYKENWEIHVPKELAAEKIILWVLSSWKMKGEKRFQTVFSETGDDFIFAFSGKYWAIIGACDDSCYPQFQAVRAIHHHPDKSLGEVVNHFLAEPNNFRRIEMGQVYAAAYTQPLLLKPKENSDNMFKSEINIFYGLGHSQEELEQTFLVFFDNQKSKILQKIKKDNIELLRPKELSLFDKRNYLKKVSLCVLKGLIDTSGGIVAAPECDLDFRNSGGYGFVWPRDAAFCALSLIENKCLAEAKSILLFLAKVQLQNGDFFQRYECTGSKAPSWCNLQADQLGLTIIVMLEFLKYEKNDIMLHSIRNGILKLIHDFKELGSLQFGFDLWEEHYGLHFYSHVCAYGALNRSLSYFPEIENKIRNAMRDCINFCTNQLYVNKQKRFARSIDSHHNRDLRADISLLSCIFPVCEFPIDDSIKLSIFKFCCENLTKEYASLRYENDSYMGGNSWILSGFWMAIAAKELAKNFSEYNILSEDIFLKTINLSNEAGFFSEQVNSFDGTPVWVMPLAWSHAFYLIANLKI